MKVVLGIIPLCFGTRMRPSSYDQLWNWIVLALPGGELMYLTLLAVVCWAVETKHVFDKVMIRTPCDTSFHACSLWNYWACLHNADMKQIMKFGTTTTTLNATIIVLQRQGRLLDHFPQVDVFVHVIEDADVHSIYI
jgi:hypothetical protein